MAKKMLLTVDGAHKKVVKPLLTVDSVHHLVKKAFVTIGGVHRPCLGSGPAQYGPIDDVALHGVYAAASVGNYALFAGSIFDLNLYGEMGCSGVVHAYNSSLTKTNLGELLNPDYYTYSLHDYAAASVGNYALIAGGYMEDYWGQYDEWGEFIGYSSYATSVVHAFNTSLTHSYPTELSAARCGSIGLSVGNRALFLGGCGVEYDDEGYPVIVASTYGHDEKTTIDVYDSSLTRTILSNNRWFSTGLAYVHGPDAAISFGDIAFVQTDNVIRMFNSSLTISDVTVLNDNMGGMCTGIAGNYALFAGGCPQEILDNSNKVYAVNKSLTTTTAPNTTWSIYSSAGLSLSDSAVFVYGESRGSHEGGFTMGYGQYEIHDIYDSSLTKTTPVNRYLNLEDNHQFSTSKHVAKVGNYYLYKSTVAGEVPEDTVSKIEAYTM